MFGKSKLPKLWVLIGLFAVSKCSWFGSKSNEKPTKVSELDSGVLSANLLEWEADVVVMFYAPWCRNSKDMSEHMQTIAAGMESNKNLIFGQMDCDVDSNKQLCTDFKVDRYPAIYFIGYGDLNQAPNGAILGSHDSEMNPRIAQFITDLYPNVVQDWIATMVRISTFQRRWDDIVTAFTGKSRVSKKNEAIKKQLKVLENKAASLTTQLARFHADEIFDGYIDYGDPFPLMHSLEPDENNLPLRICIGEMSAGYCKYHPEERYCKIIGSCQDYDMKPEKCRPSECPFENHRGCVVASVCMQPETIMKYKTALSSIATEQQQQQQQQKSV